MFKFKLCSDTVGDRESFRIVATANDGAVFEKRLGFVTQYDACESLARERVAYDCGMDPCKEYAPGFASYKTPAWTKQESEFDESLSENFGFQMNS